MEGIDGIIQIVQSLGFPIACVIAMFAMWQKEVSSHREEMEKIRSSLAEQNKATVEALQGNTVVLAKILTKLGEE